MSEIAVLPPQVELQPDFEHNPDIEVPKNIEIEAGHFIQPSKYFEVISQEDRDTQARILKADTEQWLGKFLGLWERAGNLFEDPMRSGNKKNNGVLYSSIRIADQINSGNFFDNLKKEVKTSEFGSEVVPLTEAEFNQLIDTAPNEGLSLYVRMLRDIQYPQNYEGITVLTPRAFDKAREIIYLGEYDDINSGKGTFCGEAEGYFMQDALQEGLLKPIILDGTLIAWRKMHGEQTALLAVDSVLNGVLIPKGSLVTVGKGDNGELEFSFARLTAFSVSSPQEIEAMAPYLTSNPNFVANSTGYELVRRLLGTDSRMTIESLNDSLTAIQKYFEEDSEAMKIRNILTIKKERIKKEQSLFEAEISKDYEAVSRNHSFNTYYEADDTIDQRKIKDEKAKAKDNAFRKVGERERSPTHNPIRAYLRALKDLENMFGKNKVLEVVRILRDRDIAERTLRTSR